MTSTEKLFSYLTYWKEIPPFYYLAASIIATSVQALFGRWKASVLAAYLFLMLAVTLFLREPAEAVRYQLEVLWSYEAFGEQWPQILANIFVYVPIGALLAKEWGKKSVLFGFVFSCFTEVMQLVTKRGLFEIDDILHNTLGAAIGYSLVMLYFKDRE